MANTEFHPDWASAPGETIADILRERDLSEIEFARGIGRSLEEARSLLQGQASITLAIARKLEAMLGASVEFWMSRDYQYQQDVSRLEKIEKKWLSELPLADMIRFGWLPKPRPSEDVTACLRFFDVPTVGAWNAKYSELRQMVAFRTSAAFPSRPGAVAAWVRQGEIEAQAIECKPWDVEKFQRTLRDTRALTREKDPNRFIPELKKRFAECGVAVVSLRAPTGCRASGATRFLSERKAALLLSFRYLSDDQLWFTFFHEAGHLLLHGKKEFFLEGDDTPNTTEEEEANNFAVHTLVPSEFQSELLNLRSDARTVIRFAMKVGISPGIVVGQLQHLNHIRRNQLNRLKRRYVWDE